MSRWENLALCPEVDPELFFPDKGGSPREALLICHRCEVEAECLADTLAWEAPRPGELYGVAGGKTAKERELMLGRRPSRAKGKSSAADESAGDVAA